MLRRTERILENIPVGSLGLISLTGCEELGKKVDDYLVKWRHESGNAFRDDIAFSGYEKDSYLLDARVPRFGSGEAKGVLGESVRGKDLYLMVDVCNYSITYSLAGKTNHMSPDDHFQNLKRIIAAIGGKGRRINVIMPFLYESRQHKRSSRESLDCALALQELVRMGVENIITFDAHDPRVQNAIPLSGFETVSPTYQFIKGLLRNVKDLQIDADHMMAISPDEGGTNRAVYLANVLGLDMGMFYKRRDYTKIVDGRNPIVAHEFLGSSVEGKDVIIIDDMISSGDSIIDVATELKQRKANRIFAAATFGLFTNGMEKFDKAYEDGIIHGFTALLKAGMHTATVSLDGFADEHNWMRGHPQSFDKAVRAIRMMAAIPGFVFDVVTCVNKHNYAQLNELKEFLIGIGLKQWRLFTVFPVGRAASDAELQLSGEEFRGMLDFIKQTRKEGRIRISYGCEGFLGNYEGDVRDHFFSCQAGITVGSVLIDGSISACPSIRADFHQGNIYKDEFMDVWENNYQPYRDRTWMKKGECATCKYFRYCRGNGMHLRDGQGELMVCHLKRIVNP